LLQGQSVGPFPPEFQLLSTGFLPDPLGGDSLRLTSLLLGVLAAAALVFFKLRAAQAAAKHGMEVEPLPFFLVKNLVFVALIVALSALLSPTAACPTCWS
jgi:putative multiple sugar transport system permease protein